MQVFSEDFGLAQILVRGFYRAHAESRPNCCYHRDFAPGLESTSSLIMKCLNILNFKIPCLFKQLAIL